MFFLMLSKSYLYCFSSFYLFLSLLFLFYFCLSVTCFPLTLIFPFLLPLLFRKLFSANTDVKLWDFPMSIYMDSALEVLTVWQDRWHTYKLNIIHIISDKCQQKITDKEFLTYKLPFFNLLNHNSWISVYQTTDLLDFSVLLQRILFLSVNWKSLSIY